MNEERDNPRHFTIFPEFSLFPYLEKTVISLRIKYKPNVNNLDFGWIILLRGRIIRILPKIF